MPGVLYARSAGAWVPISTAAAVPLGARWVLDPAMAGPRLVTPTEARFGHMSANGEYGYMSSSNGYNYITTSYGQAFRVYSRNAADTGYDEAMAANQTAIRFPQAKVWIGSTWTGRPGAVLGLDGSQGNVNAWGLLFDAANADTYVNGAGNLGLYVGNAAKLVFNATSATLSVPMVSTGNYNSSYNSPNNDWNYAHFIANGASGSPARISFNYPGNAPQIRAYATDGCPASINLNQTAFAPFMAASFPIGSALATKQHVRTLRPERERIVVHHTPLADVAPPVDIMALRPVAYRPKVTPQCLDADNNIIDEPAHTVAGIQGRRERLGLIADEVAHIIPSAVHHSCDGDPIGIDYAQITVALLDHVQALTETVATLRYRITELENR